MEKLSDFFSELKDRISNPLILSYLIGWCIWNYEIVVGLIFYKSKELKVDGYDSFLDLIKCNSNTWHFFWLPLFSALVYTFLFPFLKNLILAFGAWIDKWGGNWNLNISKAQKVSSEIYLKYKIQYEESIEKISKYANDEQNFNDKLVTLKAEKEAVLTELETSKSEGENSKKYYEVQLMEKDKTIHSWQYANSTNFLDGDWFMKTTKKKKTSDGRTIDEVKIFATKVESGQIIMMDEAQISNTLFITNILCNFQLVFVITKTNYAASETNVWQFSINNKNTSILKGIDGNNVSIEMRKKLPVEPPIVDND